MALLINRLPLTAGTSKKGVGKLGGFWDCIYLSMGVTFMVARTKILISVLFIAVAIVGLVSHVQADVTKHERALMAIEDKNYEEARRILEPLAAEEDADAIGTLGFFYEFGLGVEKNINEAVKRYQKSSLLGNVKSIESLALLYFDDENSINKDEIKSERWALRSAENGSLLGALIYQKLYEGRDNFFGLQVSNDYKSSMVLGSLIKYKYSNEAKDRRKIREFWHKHDITFNMEEASKLASLDDVMSIITFICRDYVKISIYKDIKHDVGCNGIYDYLVSKHSPENGVFEPDMPAEERANFIDDIIKISKNIVLGKIDFSSSNLNDNERDTLLFDLRMPAKQALFMIAKNHLFSKKSNEEKQKGALELFKFLHDEQGVSNATIHLSNIYNYGGSNIESRLTIELPELKNPELGVVYMLALAKAGVASAQNDIGWSFERGLGVEADLTRAYMWYSISQDNGLSEMKGNLERLKKILSPRKRLDALYLKKKCVESKYSNC